MNRESGEFNVQPIFHLRQEMQKDEAGTVVYTKTIRTKSGKLITHPTGVFRFVVKSKPLKK